MSFWIDRRVKPEISKISNPFMREIAHNLQLVPTHKVPTLGIQGYTVFINPGFISKIGRKHIKALLEHEIHHLIYSTRLK